MAGERKEKPEDSGINPSLLAAGLVAVILLAAGAYYFGLFKAAEPAPVQMLPLNMPDAKLLLSSMQKEAALTQVHMKYTDVEDGSPTTYDVVKNGTDGWVREEGDYGSFEGYFGSDNRSYIICLNYKNSTKCAKTGTNSNAVRIANQLLTRLPDSRASSANRDFAGRLIAAGAMKFTGKLSNETAGAFSTQKLGYIMDYRNLTVQSLMSIGVQPSDPAIYSITNWSVTNWIDSKTGLLVRSSTAYFEGGAAHSFSRDVLVLETGGVTLPERPQTLVSSDAFVKFYQEAESNYQDKRNCLAQKGSEQANCLKSMAVENADGSLCQLISDEKSRGQCLLVVAQNTRNAALCQGAMSLSDDCYIAVVSQTGNAALCSQLKNTSLLESCYKAKVSGDFAAAAANAEQARLAAGTNCKNDSDCRVAGNANQYCVANAKTGPFANETAPQFACLAGVPCGCLEGYCQFRTLESQNYSQCIGEVEKNITSALVKSLMAQNENATANNSSGRSR